MDNIENALLEKALQFLYERSLAKAGLQADIIVIKKSENEEEKVS